MSLLSKILHEIFGGIPAQFTSAYSLQESIDRLQSRTKRKSFAGLFEPSTIGRVSAQKVRLQRVVPFVGNSFKPVFRGQFKCEADAVILEGEFTKFLVTRIFMGFWFGFGTLWVLASCFFALGMALAADTALDVFFALAFPLFGVAILALGYFGVRFGWQWNRGDIEFLSDVISRALSPEYQVASRTK